MSVRKFCLILIFLCPVTIWVSVFSHYETWMDRVVSLFYQIGIAFLFTISIVILTVNVALSCISNWFRKAYLNGFLLTSLIAFGIACGYISAKLKLLNPLLKKVLPNKFVYDLYLHIKKVFIKILWRVTIVAVVSRIIYEIGLYLFRKNNTSRTALT